MIIILGAPRTGSTLLYQLVVNFFEVNYFSNDGLLWNAHLVPVLYESQYGKTAGKLGPSEASRLLSRWFGRTDKVLPGFKTEMMATIQEPMAIKNIWNVYRIDEWARLFPDVQFIHIRRNRLDAARSYAKSMRENKHGLNPAFLYHGVEENMSVYSPYSQAGTQDLLINSAIYKGLEGKDFIQVWYNDLCNQTAWELVRLRKFLKAEYREREIPKLVAHD